MKRTSCARRKCTNSPRIIKTIISYPNHCPSLEMARKSCFSLARSECICQQPRTAAIRNLHTNIRFSFLWRIGVSALLNRLYSYQCSSASSSLCRESDKNRVRVWGVMMNSYHVPLTQSTDRYRIGSFPN